MATIKKILNKIFLGRLSTRFWGHDCPKSRHYLAQKVAKNDNDPSVTPQRERCRRKLDNLTYILYTYYILFPHGEKNYTTGI